MWCVYILNSKRVEAKKTSIRKQKRRDREYVLWACIKLQAHSNSRLQK